MPIASRVLTASLALIIVSGIFWTLGMRSFYKRAIG